MPAALRSVAGPRALLPPLSPHLGPIVGLGAPGGDGGKDAARVGGNGEEEESAREGEGGEGSPALRPVRGVSPAKLSQFKRRLPRPPSPNSLVQENSPRAPTNRVKKKKAETETVERPRGHSLVSPPAPEWLQKRRLPREPPGSGAESRLRKRNKNKQLKMAATAAASPAPQRHRPERSTPARAQDATICAKLKGETGKEE